MILKSDYVPQFDPFRDYLDNLPEWDGIDYVDLLAQTVRTTQPLHFAKCLKKWMVAMVASLIDMNAMNQTAIILSGAQELEKPHGSIQYYQLSSKSISMRGIF